MTRPTGNIQRLLDDASESQWIRGSNWYVNAHGICRGLAYAYTLPLMQVCGVVAALSPATSPRRNFEDSERLFTRFQAGDLPNTEGINTYGKQVSKAYLCLGAQSAEDVSGILNGPKTTAFFKLLLEPGNPSVVVIDRYAAGIVDSKVYTRTSFTNAQYAEYVAAYSEVAASTGLLPSQIQAITWLKWREDRNEYDSLC